MILTHLALFSFFDGASEVGAPATSALRIMLQLNQFKGGIIDE